jgi:hypothetical protein
MPSGALYHVAVARTDVSENVSSLSSGFLRVTRFHSRVTVESLLLIRSIEGYYLWLKDTVLWNSFTVVSIMDSFWDFVPCGSSSNRCFRVPWGDRIPQLRYSGITLDQPLHRGVLFMVEGHCPLEFFYSVINYGFLLGLCTM